jgi:hypothetical protein
LPQEGIRWVAANHRKDFQEIDHFLAAAGKRAANLLQNVI